MQVSINANALRIINEMVERKSQLRIEVEKTRSGAKIIDVGVEARGGYLAGKYVTEICLGGLGSVSLHPYNYEGLWLPSIFVSTDQPAIALLGSQSAGWNIKVDKYFALGSGPARALALKPKGLHSEIGYNDQSDVAVIVLESNQKPTDEVVEYIARECQVSPEEVYAIVVPTSSISGSTQIAARVVENGLYRLRQLALDPKKVLSASGCAPIAPIHPKSNEAMGRTNDMLMYGGVTFFTVDFDNDEYLEKIVKQVPSTSSRMIQEARELAKKNPRFLKIFKEAGFNFYKIDPSVFAPAIVSINNLRTGKTFRAGNLDIPVMKESLGL